ncbi:5'-nucleotidase /3'-nucleotidase /exopolyphosphatase [Desulfotomaculum arcticum]|uniref:5'-nucleotidase SurE n=1 Tax=Desulfotruncus arcticus DSM 17038 TaxID=1121424 RepID=A0A1I2S418_9FIRM|nr:5'/3'-nucleotidase SurE [Desulfotruncus arcticus]SFG45567.1 5'-nucleotidase /3'-nucleotidase /exopolyphosphatase [Desulfotomaculum arcticum] [Desulfotruncus arcticus DSM 17038]
MRILISNDDGIQAEGLIKLKQALDPLGEVLVVAPDRERSGTGHGITVHKPLRPKQVNFNDGTTGWSVNGTPADCVKLAIEALLDKTPDIVISGINRGANLGTDVLYSGTVSAAIEGIINGIPSVAISLATYENKDFKYAARFAARVVSILSKNKLQSGCSLININIPQGSPKGVKVTRLGNRRYENVFHKRIDPRGGVYYWMAGEPKDMIPEKPILDADTDFDAVNNGFISVTPLHFDLTYFNGIGEMEKIIGLMGEPLL